MNQLLLGDCLDVLPTLSPKSVDLVLCDPPYGITSAGFDIQIPHERLWNELWRVSRGPIIFTASQPFTSVVVCQQIENFRHEWIWIKNRGSNFANTVREPMKEHESVLVFAREPWTFNKQMQERSGGGASRVEYDFNFQTETENFKDFAGVEGVKLPKLRVPSSWQKFNTEVGYHPQQKPIELFRYLIRTYSNEGEVVLDFACGSGTTALAALKEKRSYICIEKEERFFKTAEMRINLMRETA